MERAPFRRAERARQKISPPRVTVSSAITAAERHRVTGVISASLFNAARSSGFASPSTIAASACARTRRPAMALT